MQSKLTFLFLLLSSVAIHLNAQKNDKGWEALLDKDLSNWDVFIGVPHTSLDLEGYEKGDGMHGTPIGLNNDPLNVFTTSQENGETILNVSGQIYGGLSTKKEYENYHLVFDIKWGTKKYEPRLKDKRDSGVLYHAQEPHGQFWNVWMKAPEMQVQETDCGDFFPLAGVSMDIKASKRKENGKEFWFYDPKGEVHTFKTGANGRCRRMDNFENPHGEWSRLELICINDKAYHIVNGKVVMVLENAKEYDQDGVASALTKGKIQFQSEACEVYYKNIKIRNISKLPKYIKKQL
ncbi:protein of unknown function [Zobellia uliginosa]|uniref:3-keto-alpha-glucoside-1,2-lyase/3-keto-2-hydroxy-glucal hydratase domain-containing protein n=1 Tax=Zobellia uliginosa TaxID=143224 RepID=A0ABY1KQJ3_9FLAO|nr:DUF1080 domain-containing protein [Zobellia uliginosa]SIS64653.1 protein of unknown function [Zobellia uliginosa]